MEADPTPDRRPIGELFVARGFVSEEDLRAALEQQRETGEKLGEILVERGLISRLALASILSEQWDADDRQTRLVRVEDAPEVLAGTVPEIGALAELRELVDELREVASSSSAPAGSVDTGELAAALGESLRGELSTPAADAGVADAIAELGTKIDALATRLGGPLGLGGLQQGIEELKSESATGELVAAIEALGTRLAGPLGAQGVLQAVDGLETRVVERHESLVEELRAIAAGLGAPGAAAVDLGGLERALDARLTELSDQIRATTPGADPGAADLARAVEELRAALPVQTAAEPADDSRPALTAADLDAALAGIRESLEARDADIQALVSSAGDRAPELQGLADELRHAVGSLAEFSPAAGTDELRAELERLRARLDEQHGVDLGPIERRLEELRESLPAQRDDAPVVETIRGELEALAVRLNGPLGSQAAVQAVEELRESLRERDVELSGAMEALRSGLDAGELRSSIDELRAGLADRPGGDEGTVLRAIHELRAGLEESIQAVARSDESGAVESLRGDIESLGARLTGPLGTQAVVQAVEELRRELSAADPTERIAALLAERDAATTAAIQAVAADLGGRMPDRDELQRAVADLRAGLGERDASLTQAIERLRGKISRRGRGDDGDAHVTERIEQLEGSLAGSLADLRSELDALATRLTGPLGTQAVVQAVEELKGELAGVDVTERMAGLLAERDAATAAAVERIGVELGERLSGASEPAVLDASALEPLRQELEALRGQLHEASARDDAPAAALESLRSELDALATRLTGPLGMQATVQAVEDVRSELAAVKELLERRPADDADDRDGRLLEAVRELGVPQLDAALDSLRGELGGLAERLLQPVDELARGLRTELGERDGRIDDLLTGRLDALREELASRESAIAEELRRAAEGIGRLADHEREAIGAERLEGLERALGELAEGLGHNDPAARVDESLARLRERQEHDAHEVRSLLASLEHRITPVVDEQALAEREAAIARLEGTVAELEEKLASVPQTTPEPEPEPERSHLALVPSGGGYALVEQDGPAPAVGSELDVPDREGRFSVSKVGRSPLPADTRRCAYLAPVA